MFHQGLGDGAGTRHAGHANDQRRARALLEARDLAPHEMLTEMVPVIRSKDDDRVVPQAVLLKRVEEHAQLGIDEGDTGVVGLGVLPAQGVVFLAQLETEGCKALHHRLLWNVIPVVGRAELEAKVLHRVLIKILLRGQKGDVRLLYAAGDEEGLVAKTLLVEPFDDLSDVFPVLVLLVSQLRRAIPRLRLTACLLGKCLKRRPPGLAIPAGVGGTVLRFEGLARFCHPRQFVVLEHDLFVPGDLALLLLGRMENLADAGGPVAAFLEALRQGDRAGRVSRMSILLSRTPVVSG